MKPVISKTARSNFVSSLPSAFLSLVLLFHTLLPFRSLALLNILGGFGGICGQNLLSTSGAWARLLSFTHDLSP